eukprot:7442862-Alexandrium_andersonii.AAC.1
MLAQPRVTGRQTLIAPPEAHALQDLRRGAHPANWFPRKMASRVRTHGPDARARRRRKGHAKPAH